MAIDKDKANPLPFTNSKILDEPVNIERRHIVDQLPEVHKTELLKKFFANTGDNLFQPEMSEQLSGFIGRIPSFVDFKKEFYIAEPTKERSIYQLEPTLVSIDTLTNNIEQSLFYEDIVNLLRFQGGLVENHDRLFNTETYSWAPPINYDKFLNSQNYFWFPDTSGDPGTDLISPTPDYIVMEMGARDGNPWSVRNRWFHNDDLTEAEKELSIKAVRPIIEFKKDLELFNYGSNRRNNITVRDNVTIEPGIDILESANPVVIDGITLVDGDTILFTNSDITTFGNWDLKGWDFENDPSGKWDEFIGSTFSSPTNDITLLSDIGTGKGTIISATANFMSLGFKTGMAIILQGTDGNDGLYTIDFVSPNTIIISIPFPNPAGFGLQPNNITILENPVNYKDHVFEINGIGSSVTLTLIADGNNTSGSPEDGDIFLILSGDEFGSIEIFWNSSINSWINAQSKSLGVAPFLQTRNIAPLFQLYDDEGIKLQDPGKYPNSTFNGSKIFNFLINQNLSQIEDEQLDIRLSFDKFGEIEYENFIVTERYTFNLPSEEIVGYYFHRTVADNIENDEFSNDWYLKANLSRQFLLEDFSTETDKLDYILTVTPNDPLEVEVFFNGELQNTNSFNVVNKTVTFNTSFENNNLLRIRYYSIENPPITGNAVYEIPTNLEANPDNIEVDITSKSNFFEHFTNIIKNQPGLTGNPNSVNNFRSLSNIDLSLGNKIFQHRAPLLKLMALGTNRNIDFMLSVTFVEREFHRFKNKFLKKIETFINDINHDETVDTPAKWVDDAIALINIGRSDSFPFAFSGMGLLNNNEPTFIPPSPSRLGVFPVYKPEIYTDLTLKSPRNMIQLHDGSLAVAFNDFRDEVILELENRIFDNIPDEYKTENRPDFDWLDFVESEFRNGEYSLDEFNTLLTPIIQRWSAFQGINIEKNDIFDPDDPLTFNYSSTGLPGYWRGIFKKIYDTDRPNTHPWEMFGFTIKPDWWEIRYGDRPYRFNNPNLWNDMNDGFIADGPRKGIDPKYARPGAPIPINNSGNIIDPITLGLSPTIGQTDAKSNWAVGDHGPAETVFRRSEFWSFAIAQISYLMKPSKFIELGWDPKDHLFRYSDGSNPQWLNIPSGTRRQNSAITVHGETLPNGNIYQSDGMQQWISDWVISNGQSITNIFGNVIRGIDVRLGHKMAGFINIDNNRILVDNLSGPLPSEDINVLLYKNPSIREEFYGGVIIEKVTNGWQVFGYDLLTGKFFIFPGVKAGKKNKIVVSGLSLSECTEFKTNTIVSVPYGTVFKTHQGVFDFLISYGKFLESRGWVFDDPDIDSNEIRGWRLAGKQFLFWSQGNWADGSVITLSPSSQKIKFRTKQGHVQGLEQIINGVYSLLNKDNGIIQPQDTFVNRCGDELVVIPETDQAIFAARLFVVENEHVLIFNNVTIFNDLIYDQLYNLRQARLRLFTTRTLEWNGRIDAPGYIITGNNIIPNYEKTVTDFRRFYEIENQVDRQAQREAAQRMIGFQSREYLDSMLVSPLSQFQFYQGFIKQKGTPSTLNRLLRSDIASGSNDVKFFEEWALHLGNYGAVSDFISAEIKIKSEQWRANPQIIEFTATTLDISIDDTDDTIILTDSSNFPPAGIISIDDELIQYNNNVNNTLSNVTRGVKNTTAVAHSQNSPVGLFDNLFDDTIMISPHDDRWRIKPPEDGIAVFRFRNIDPSLRNQNASYFTRNDNPVAGYVESREVKFRVRSIEERNTIVTNILTGLDETNTIEIGNQIWVDDIGLFYNIVSEQAKASAFNFGFQVFTLVGSGSTFTSITRLATNPGDNIAISVTNPGNWNIGDTIIISGIDGLEPDINGAHIIIDIEGIDLVIDLPIADATNIDISESAIYKFSEARFIDEVDRDAGNFGNVTTKRFAYVDTRSPVTVPAFWEVYETIENTPMSSADWTAIRKQELKVDSASFKEAILFNEDSNNINARLHIFDPAKGLYPGQALSEIKFRIEYDPAKYNRGDETRFQIDPEQVWGELQVGQVWWDLSTLEYENYEIGTNRERRNKWGRLAPGKSIDVYEWVRSSVPPSQWVNLVRESADQPEDNFRYKPSGEARLGEDSGGPFVEQRIVNARTNIEQAIFYFWVKTSETKPNIPNRNKPIAQLAREMTDPSGSGIFWFSPINDNALIISNIQALLTTDDSIFQFNYNFNLNQNNLHREWILLKEGSSDVPPLRFWNKMKDSLVGLNNQFLFVPDPNLEEIRKQGNSIRPRESWFIDNEAATRVFFNKINEILSKDCVADRENIFNNLFNKTPEPLPYGTVLALARPIDICEFNDPLNLEVDIDPGTISAFHVSDNNERDNLFLTDQIVGGQQIWVDGTPETRGFWTVYKVNPLATGLDDAFELTCQESFRVQDFWILVDFFIEGVDKDTVLKAEVDTLAERDALIDIIAGDIVRVNDINGDGTNIWTLFRRNEIDELTEWTIVGKKDCSIEFNVDLFFDITYGNNDSILKSIDLPDGVPGRQLAMKEIINALKNNILTDEEQNLIFFNMINFVHSEQLLVDWVFKTTYIVGLGLNRTIGQDPILIQDRTKNFISFIEEAKPYHTKLREFITQENFGFDIANVNITEIVRDFNIKLVFDRTSCDVSSGWDPIFGWDFEANNFWDFEPLMSNIILDSFILDDAGMSTGEHKILEQTSMADRIVSSYKPQPILQSDIQNQKVDESINLTTLISGCDFRETIIDSGRHEDLLQTTIGGWSDIDDSPWETIPWSSLGSAANVIDISDYDASYDGGPNELKTVVRIISDGIETTFAIDGFILGDTVSVLVNDVVQIDPDDYTIVGTDIVFVNPPANTTIIRISLYASETFKDAPVSSISNILVDGNLFKQPHIDNNHPEELILGVVGESVSIKVNFEESLGNEVPVNHFRLFLDNINSRESINIKPILKTTLVNDIDDTQTLIELDSITGFSSGVLNILSQNSITGAIQFEKIFVRSPQTIDQEFSAYSPVGSTITLDSDHPFHNSNQLTITVRDTINGTETELALGTNYTVDTGTNSITFIDDIDIGPPVVIITPKPTATQFIKIKIIYAFDNIVCDVIRGYDGTAAVFAPRESTDLRQVFDASGNPTTTTSVITLSIVTFEDESKPQIADWTSQRILETTTLAEDLNFDDTTIELTSVAGLPKQVGNTGQMASPGVIWIGTERIEFFERKGTTLKQIVRGSKGTSFGIPDVYDSVSGRLLKSFNRKTTLFPAGDITLNLNGLNGEIISSTFNFTTLGLTIGQKISFFNSVDSINSGIYTINNISTTTLKLDEEFTGPIGIQNNETSISFSNSEILTIPSGTEVINASKKHEIPDGYEWFPSPNGLEANSTNPIAKFINGL